ncbi:MAG TPA: hypothetical protein D7I05_04535 [Candidatus Poseidoniales archaeon]|nr:MAG TPA: hypothetical protein D7I05_04535 [Candidatus Poseidoniales archaeon]
MKASIGNSSGGHGDCTDCGGALHMDSLRAELACSVCGLTFDAPTETMDYVPEGHGTTRVGNPYHHEATGSTIGTGRTDLRDVPASQRALYRRIAAHNRFSKPSQPQHTAAKVWEFVSDENGQALANAMYDANMLDDLLRPVRFDHKCKVLTKRAEAILAKAEAEGIHLIQPSGQWSRATSTGRTKEERDANKLNPEQKQAILAAACVSLFGALYPMAPSNVSNVQTRLLERTGLPMKVAKQHLLKAKSALSRHLRDLAKLGFFTPRTRNVEAHQQWIESQVGLHMDELHHALSKDDALTPYLEGLFHQAALRLDAMAAVDKAMGVESPYMHLPPVKRAGLAMYSALHSAGLERGRRGVLATVLVLCDDTIPLLRDRLLEEFDEGLDPVS